jgi:hypothetical protein
MLYKIDVIAIAAPNRMGEIGWNFTTVRRGHQEWD